MTAHRSGKRARCILLAVVAGLVSTRSPQAFGATYTWTGANTTSGNWSANTAGTTNWSGNVVPVSDASTQLLFSTNTSGKASNQDIASPFTLNSLTLGSGLPAMTISGNTLQFAANGAQKPQIVRNGTETINCNIDLTDDLTISGFGGLALGGAIDGAHALATSGS